MWSKGSSFLLVGEELSRYLTLFVRGRTQSQQNESLRVSETVPRNWYYLVHTRQPSLEEIYPQKWSVSLTSRRQRTTNGWSHMAYDTWSTWSKFITTTFHSHNFDLIVPTRWSAGSKSHYIPPPCEAWVQNPGMPELLLPYCAMTLSISPGKHFHRSLFTVQRR